MIVFNDKTKHLLLSSILCLTATLCTTAQNNATVCRLGFAYELSQRRQWGFEKPVVRSLVPNSSADQSGLKVDDVIELIDGVNVTEVAQRRDKELSMLQEIAQYTDSSIYPVFLVNSDCKECRRANAITEDQLLQLLLCTA